MQSCPKCDSTNIKKNKTYKYYDIYECLGCDYWEYKRIEDCCRNSFDIVVKEQKDHDNYRLYYQCVNCGGSINRTKPLSQKKYSNDSEGEFNQHSFYNWKLERERQGTELFEHKQISRLLNSRKYKYDEYLLTEKWKDKRQLVHARENNICQRCKIKPSEVIHHIHYDNLFNEPLEDLEALCNNCHSKHHAKIT